MRVVCVAHGPTCKNVRHNAGPIEVWESQRDSRRLMRVAIGNHFLTQILNGSFSPGKVTSDLPKDAEIVSVRADPYRDCVVAWVRSKDFNPVEEGREVPELILTFTVTTTDLEIEG